MCLKMVPLNNSTHSAKTQALIQLGQWAKKKKGLNPPAMKWSKSGSALHCMNWIFTSILQLKLGMAFTYERRLGYKIHPTGLQKLRCFVLLSFHKSAHFYTLCESTGLLFFAIQSKTFRIHGV